jgi:hypothetical protein
MGGDRLYNEALNQVLNLQAAKAASGPPAKLRNEFICGLNARRACDVSMDLKHHVVRLDREEVSL